MIEHNLIALSRLYSSLSLKSAGRRLGVSEEEAEEIAGNMIEQGRLLARIDQEKEAILFFNQGAEVGGIGGGSGGGMVSAAAAVNQAGGGGGGGAAAKSGATTPSAAASASASTAATAAAASSSSSSLNKKSGVNTMNELNVWDAEIQSVCLTINKIVEAIENKHPQFAQ